MAITKTIENDKFEIVSEHKHLQVRTATVLAEDGVELSRTFSRRVLTPDMDISSESTEIQNICNSFNFLLPYLLILATFRHE